MLVLAEALSACHDYFSSYSEGQCVSHFWGTDRLVDTLSMYDDLSPGFSVAV